MWHYVKCAVLLLLLTDRRKKVTITINLSQERGDGTLPQW